jgi:hypothetical protein
MIPKDFVYRGSESPLLYTVLALEALYPSPVLLLIDTTANWIIYRNGECSCNCEELEYLRHLQIPDS